MRAEHLIAPLILLPFLSCTTDPGADGVASITTVHREDHDERSVALDPVAFDIVQRTCALYVAVRSSAWQESIAFGRDLDDSMVRWNVCPGGTMVACAVAPTANGDTVITGIPWLHADRPSH